MAARPSAVVAACEPTPSFAPRVEVLSQLMAALYDVGWGRYGWPEAVGGSGGTIVHRAAMWEVLARHGVRGMGALRTCRDPGADARHDGAIHTWPPK